MTEHEKTNEHRPAHAQHAHHASAPQPTPTSHRATQQNPAQQNQKVDTKGITIKKADDMAEWYGQVVIKSELADYAPIRGFMVIRPAGYSIWQTIQDELNIRIQKNGVRNAYFPFLIPESFFHKEAEHAEGFSPEVAWIESKPGDQERYAVRPTSETIMYDSYSRWIRSWRDLPLKINQWCNIVRWEVQDTKIFLRTREFLWQEGHCVYETEKECHKETMKYLEFYRQVAEDVLAVPVVLGKKSHKEKFAGAIATYTIEGFMPDGKSLQMGTSHDLGQGFAKAFNISFLGKDGTTQLPWQNSWGFSTRLLGALIMTHSDDKGLVLPPKAAYNKVAIVPIIFDDTKEKTLAAAQNVAKQLKRYTPLLDDREGYSAGYKFNEHELRGIPIRIEIGPKDVDKNQVVVVRRDTGEKKFIPIPELADTIKKELDLMQSTLFEKARARVQSSIVNANNWEEFLARINEKKLVLAPHCAEDTCEADIKEVTKGVTTRCVPFKAEKLAPETKCVHCEKKAKYNIYFARAY